MSEKCLCGTKNPKQTNKRTNELKNEGRLTCLRHLIYVKVKSYNLLKLKSAKFEDDITRNM